MIVALAPSGTHAEFVGDDLRRQCRYLPVPESNRDVEVVIGKVACLNFISGTVEGYVHGLRIGFGDGYDVSPMVCFGKATKGEIARKVLAKLETDGTLGDLPASLAVVRVIHDSFLCKLPPPKKGAP